MMFPFVKYRKFYFLFSLVLVGTSIIFLMLWGLNFGIEFTGGSELRFEYKNKVPDISSIKEHFEKLNLENISIRRFGEKGVIVRAKEIDTKTQGQLFSELKKNEEINPESITFEEIGSIIGKETTKKALKAIILSIVAIILYVAFAFRKMGKGTKPWEYGIATVIALMHDVLLPVGIFAFLGHIKGVEFSLPVLTALLTIFGYSVNDTVVVFDRIRENQFRFARLDFEEIVDKSLNQTLRRSINTSLTTLFVLLALFFLGGESLKYFSLALILGTVFGTYSSIFLASPLLVSWHKMKSRRK
ncbi:protein translocase subunit SecF [bacterium]|nr:protein translocase subunit SecF [bacterium]